MNQALRQWLRRVDEDELRALLSNAVGDEGGYANWEPINLRVPYRSGALLPIDDPSRFLMLPRAFGDRDDELAGAHLIALPTPTSCYEAHSRIKSHDERVR